MSKYTTEVRYICENYAGLDESTGYDNVDDTIEAARTKVFDFDFPMYDEAYRPVLETKILKHYYTREIGFETVGLWKLWLNKRLNEIMPYYNQMYKSETLTFNPFYDVNFTIKRDDKFGHEGSDSNTRTDALSSERTDNLNSQRTDNLSESTNSSSTRTDDLAHSDSGTNYDLYSDTPQGELTGVDAENYLTNARKVTDNTSGTNTGTQKVEGTGTVNNTGTQNVANTGTQTVANTGTQKNEGTDKFTNTDEYVEHVAGKRNYATYSSLLNEYRETFLNIDMMIIEDLSDLFMNVW